jgi:hypothetical protein
MSDEDTSIEPTAPEAEPAEDKGTDDPRVAKANKEAANYRGRLREAEKELAQFRKDAEAKAEADKSETEKRTAAEDRAAKAELRVLRLEVAHEKGLTPTQSKRLVGDNREDLEADADEILRDFPAAANKPKAPKTDPSQGSRGGKPASGREAALAEAQKRFGTRSTAT